MMKFLMDKNIQNRMLFAGRLLVGVVFIFSGLSKLVYPIEYFEIAIGFYDVIPFRFTHSIALILPWVELIFGFYVLLGYWVRGSAGILACLTGFFQILLAQALMRRLPIDECG